MHAQISLPISSIKGAPFLTVYRRSCDGVRDAHRVLGEDRGVLSNNPIGGHSRGGVMASKPPQQEAPPDDLRHLEAPLPDVELRGMPCGLSSGVAYVGVCYGVGEALP